MTEIARFQIGHMCAGCPASDRLHTGCIVANNVRIMSETRDDSKKVDITDSTEKNSKLVNVILMNTY